MAGSRYLRAKRAFVALLLSLARAYQLSLDVNRDSQDDLVQKAYHKVPRKVHPDKGGQTADARRSQEEPLRSEGLGAFLSHPPQ